jgi:hypothetical protein
MWPPAKSAAGGKWLSTSYVDSQNGGSRVSPWASASFCVDSASSAVARLGTIVLTGIKQCIELRKCMLRACRLLNAT